MYNNNPYMYGQGYPYAQDNPQQRLAQMEAQYRQQMMSQQVPQVQPNNGIIWVQGIDGARAYMLPANSSAILMDSDGPFFYIKSTDNVGMPQVKAYRFEEIGNNLQQNQQQEFVPRQEFEQLRTEFNNLMSQLTTPTGGSGNE